MVFLNDDTNAVLRCLEWNSRAMPYISVLTGTHAKQLNVNEFNLGREARKKFWQVSMAALEMVYEISKQFWQVCKFRSREGLQQEMRGNLG